MVIVLGRSLKKEGSVRAGGAGRFLLKIEEGGGDRCREDVCKEEGGGCRRAKPGRFGGLAFAMKNRHFGGHCSWIIAGKARKCGRFWVFACVPNPGKQSIWRQYPPSARKQSTKKLPNRPGFTHVQGGRLNIFSGPKCPPSLFL